MFIVYLIILLFIQFRVPNESIEMKTTFQLFITSFLIFSLLFSAFVWCFEFNIGWNFVAWLIYANRHSNGNRFGAGAKEKPYRPFIIGYARCNRTQLVYARSLCRHNATHLHYNWRMAIQLVDHRYDRFCIVCHHRNSFCDIIFVIILHIAA